MAHILAEYGVFLVALIIFAGELGFPTLVPGEIALLFAGAHFIHSVPALVIGAIAFGLIDIVATSTIHVAARVAGNRLLLQLLKYICPGDDRQRAMVERCRQRLHGRDSLVVLVTRLIPILRLYASVTTGLIRIRFRDFLLGAFPASMVWAATPLTAGYIFRRQIVGIEKQYGVMTYLIVASSVLMILLIVAGGWIRRAASPAATLCRLRLVVGLAVVSTLLARLLTLVLYAHRMAPATATTLSDWVGAAGLVALGLLWVATHDMQGIHKREHRASGMGRHRGLVWINLLLTLSAVTVWESIHYPGLLLI